MGVCLQRKLNNDLLSLVMFALTFNSIVKPRFMGDRQTEKQRLGRQAVGHIGTQTNTPTGRQLDRQTDREKTKTSKQTDVQINKHTGRQTSRWTDRQRGRQTDRQRDWKVGGQTCALNKQKTRQKHTHLDIQTDR